MGPDQNQTQPTAPAGKPVRKRWYIVNTYTGSENVARASLANSSRTTATTSTLRFTRSSRSTSPRRARCRRMAACG